MGAVESNFAAFGNYSAGPFSLAFHQPPQMGVGSEIPITASYFGINQNMGVSVQSMSSSSMSFSTLPGGHLFYPGAITFSASQAGNGMVSFNINLSGTFNGPINRAKYYLGGSVRECSVESLPLEGSGLLLAGGLMLTTGLVSSMALVTLVASGVIGFIVGFITCRVLKVSWDVKMAATDTIMTVAVSIGTAFAFAAIAMARGPFDPGIGWIFLIASGSVVIRHIVRSKRHKAI